MVIPRLITAYAMTVLVFVECSSAYSQSSNAASSSDKSLPESTLTFLQTYCLDCHGAQEPDAQLDLSRFCTVDDVVANHELWRQISRRIAAHEMPPKDADRQPSDEQILNQTEWIERVLYEEASRNAGDPGYVPARRLSNAEFDNSIRDLTGFDIRPAREFPVDPANPAGFDNSGESLSMSPALLQKYYEAARMVADHVLFTPEHLVFAPHPVISETDRDKFCVRRIVNFYEKHDVNYARYFEAAWLADRGRDPNGPEQTPEQLAKSRGISPRYLGTLISALRREDSRGPFRELVDAWNNIPSAGLSEAELAARLKDLERLVHEIRADLEDPVPRLNLEGMSRGSQPLILWWNRKVAASRRAFGGDGNDPELDQLRREFCEVFPDAFCIASRGHYSDANLGKDVRLLSAGFHLMQGYFRDDTPLMELVLSDEEQRELNGLWDDLNYATEAPIRQYRDFLFFERAEPPRFAGGPAFDFARPEDRNATNPDMLDRMHEQYVLRARELQASEEILEAINEYFVEMNRLVRWIESARIASVEKHLEDLVQLTSRAWRRRLSEEEIRELKDYYASRRSELSHEDAVRDVIISVLMSPKFCYIARSEPDPDSRSDAAASDGTRPLTDHDLATRLSYFLWASLPDAELLSVAEQGQLQDSAVLGSQVQRMIADERSRGMVTEFFGNWLGFRRFPELNSVDRARFPQFDSELQQAMYEEPVRFLHDLLKRNAPCMEIIESRQTFLNATLARHYGVPDRLLNSDDQHSGGWVQIPDAVEYGRGGLLPMAVFLTQSSPGLRTSPVKRGYWVVKRLLGEQIPAPPATVPELPKDEATFGNQTLAELLAAHRNHASCSACHDRFDAVGLVFEGFGPIGERRTTDLNGNAVELAAVFPDGVERHGVAGLQEWLQTQRRTDFETTFFRQLLTYALGRSLILTDEPMVKNAVRKVHQEGAGMADLIQYIVESRQFRNSRIGSDSVR